MAIKVICQYCGKEKKTTGIGFFKCCGIAQSIKDNIKKPESKTQTQTLAKPEEDGDNNVSKGSSEHPEAISEEKEGVESTPEPPIQKVEATSIEEINKNEDSKEMAKKEEPEAETLEIEQEQEQEQNQEVNPDDYDYCCGECKELFNEEGNKKELSDGSIVIVCPDCGAILEED
jgi:DNA-directed RNA polymerase subunit RPC12/RpoP